MTSISREAYERMKGNDGEDLTQAWERHCYMFERLGIRDEEIREAVWKTLLGLRGIEYPPGPNPEQEKALIEVGRLVSEALKRQR